MNGCQPLLSRAQEAREQAYTKYSRFAVGAALEGMNGTIFTGANVENVSYGLTMCAERICVGAAVTAGCRDFRQIAICSDSDEPIVPCGACRQVLAEFAPDLHIISVTVGGNRAEYRLSELFPLPRQGILG